MWNRTHDNFVYKVIKDLESIDHLFIKSYPHDSVQVYVLLNDCKQNISSLSLLVGTTVLDTT